MNCRICGTTLNDDVILLKEKMFGTGEAFEYIKCSGCNCMQIRNIPQNLGKYYPPEYYSFNKITGKRTLKNKLKQRIYNLLSIIKNDFYRQPPFRDFEINYNDRRRKILDIGCGDGYLLNELKQYGFSNLTGIDPYINKEIILRGFRLLKNTVEQCEGKYDLVMSHHSLEHMRDPHLFFKHVARLLETNGRLILRIPIFPNYIWDKYGTDWIQLDPPRHLIIFSLDTIEFLSEKYDLKIDHVKYDAEPWALASSEFCMKGKSHVEFVKNYSVSEKQINDCRQANLNNNGDSVCLTIVKN